MPRSLHQIKLADAKNAADAAADGWQTHRKGCRTCSEPFQGRARYCPDGWDLAKDVAATRSALSRLQRGSDHLQGRLC